MLPPELAPNALNTGVRLALFELPGSAPAMTEEGRRRALIRNATEMSCQSKTAPLGVLALGS